MRILYIHTDKVTISDIPWGLLELGEEVEIYEDEITLQTYIEREQEKLTLFLKKHSFELVITHNFSPTISNACEESKVKYAAWVFDVPQIDLYTESFYNSCNSIFMFDKTEYEKTKKRREKQVYYLPLAANVTKVSAMKITQEDEAKYSNEISFVGGLYESNIWNMHNHIIPADIKEKLKDWILKKAFHWEKGNRIFGCLTKEDTERLRKIFVLGDWIDMEPDYFLEYQFMARKIGEIERICILNALAEKHQVRLYTGSDTGELQNVECRPPINISEETPKVYHLSRINLNMTLRSIETGVPQRVFDIMSCGGFLLSNYQEEMEELFEPDKEIVLFHSMEELVEKVEYYKRREAERIQIAMNGYKKVRDCYSYPVMLTKLLNIVRKEG